MENGESAAPPPVCCGFSRRRLLGLCVLVLVVIIWVGSSDLMQYIFKDNDFSSPFFLTYFATSLFTIYLFGFLRKSWRQDDSVQKLFQQLRSRYCGGYTALPASNNEASTSAEVEAQPTHAVEGSQMYPTTKVALLGLQFSMLWFLANYSFNASLTLTSVSSNTVISATSGFFTLVIGTVVKVDKFIWPKLLAVFCCLGGVTLVAYSDSRADTGHKDGLAGDLMSLFSAMMYGCYIVLLKKKIEHEDRIRMPMMFGFVGLWNIILLWPFFFILNWTGIEPFQWPSWKVVGFLSLNGLIGTVLSDYLWLWSVLLTTPLISTIGLSMTIPIAMVSDFVLFGRTAFSALYVFGCGLVLTGFILVNLADQIKERIPCPKFPRFSS